MEGARFRWTVACVCACLLAAGATGLTLLGAPAAPAGAAALSASGVEALRAVSDLRSRIERRAAADPLSRLRRAIERAPSADALNGYAVALLLTGAPANALLALAEAAAQAPTDFLAFNNLGAILNNLGQYDRALPLLRYAGELSPDNPLILANLGINEIGRGRTAEAERLFRRAVERDPKHPQANYALAMLAARAGQMQAAETYLTASLDGSYTAPAAKALRNLRRAASRAADASGKNRSAILPPVPSRAVDAGRMLRVRLPVINAKSSGDFGAVRKMLEAQMKEVNRLHEATVSETMALVWPKSAAGRAAPAPAPPAAAGVWVLRLSPDQAKRGLEQASQWQDERHQLEGQFREKDMGDRWRAFIRQRGELGEVTAAEQQQCDRLAPSPRQRCYQEVARRACGRHFATFDPLVAPVVSTYEQFARRWEAAALASLQMVNYWSSFHPDAEEARSQRVSARGAVISEYGDILVTMIATSSALAPDESCLAMPPPPPPTGELRLEDFEIPCDFRGLLLDLEVVSFAVDCTTVTVSGEVGFIVGELEWNFVEKTGTLFLGVGKSLHASRLISVDASAKIGLEISFDGDTLTGIDRVAEFSAGAAPALPLRPLDWGVERDVRVGLGSGLELPFLADLKR